MLQPVMALEHSRGGGMSLILPKSGSPFGPGGRGRLFFRHRYRVITYSRVTATAIDAFNNKLHAIMYKVERANEVSQRPEKVSG